MQQRRPMSPGDYLIAMLFGATLVVITAQIVWRYVFNDSLTWTEELARYLFVWITFVGMALAIRDRTHIRVTLVVDQLPARLRRWLDMAQLALVTLFLCLLVGVGFQWVWLNTDAVTPALGMPLAYICYVALPLASLWGIFHAGRRFVRLMRSGENDRGTEEGPG